MELQIHFSDFFEVDPSVLEDYGAFNISVLTDLPLFIDPFLLFNSPRADYQALHEEIIRYLRFLRDKAEAGSIKPGLLREWFTFSEVRQNWLGFSEVGNLGHGLGPDFARKLHTNLNAVFEDFGDEPITKGSHLEKVCLIDEGVGRDKISDFTTNLIKAYLLDYTQTFAGKHLKPEQRQIFRIPRVRFNYDTETWVAEDFELPALGDDFVLLTPRDMLTRDKTWINRPDLLRNIERIIESVGDQQLRDKLNNYLLRRLPKEPTTREQNRVVNSLLKRHPELIDYFIKNREDQGDRAVALSTKLVGESETLFVHQMAALAGSLSTETGFYAVEGYTLDEARQRLLYLKDVIENKGGHQLFYIGGKPVRREKDLQIMYRLVWYATPSDVSREVNDGRGPADFKVSRGARDKTIVELKLGSNTSLRRNLQNQAEVYQAASDAEHKLKGILCFTEDEMKKVSAILADLGLTDSPHIIVIDARVDNKPSGSRA